MRTYGRSTVRRYGRSTGVVQIRAVRSYRHGHSTFLLQAYYLTCAGIVGLLFKSDIPYYLWCERLATAVFFCI